MKTTSQKSSSYHAAITTAFVSLVLEVAYIVITIILAVTATRSGGSQEFLVTGPGNIFFIFGAYIVPFVGLASAIAALILAASAKIRPVTAGIVLVLNIIIPLVSFSIIAAFVASLH